MLPKRSELSRPTVIPNSAPIRKTSEMPEIMLLRTIKKYILITTTRPL